MGIPPYCLAYSDEGNWELALFHFSFLLQLGFILGFYGSFFISDRLTF